MLYSAYFYIAFAYHSATCSGSDIFRKRINHRLSFEVKALELVTMIVRSGTEFRVYHQSCMQSFSMNLKGLLECTLFHICCMMIVLFIVV